MPAGSLSSQDGRLVVAGHEQISAGQTRRESVLARYETDGLSRRIRRGREGDDVLRDPMTRPGRLRSSRWKIAVADSRKFRLDSFPGGSYGATGRWTASESAAGSPDVPAPGPAPWRWASRSAGRGDRDGWRRRHGLETSRSRPASLARYDANGVLDATFGAAGIVTTRFTGSAVAYAIALQGDGRIVAAGFFWATSATRVVLAVVRYEADGRIARELRRTPAWQTTERGVLGHRRGDPIGWENRRRRGWRSRAGGLHLGFRGGTVRTVTRAQSARRRLSRGPYRSGLYPSRLLACSPTSRDSPSSGGTSTAVAVSSSAPWRANRERRPPPEPRGRCRPGAATSSTSRCSATSASTSSSSSRRPRW